MILTAKEFQCGILLYFTFLSSTFALLTHNFNFLYMTNLCIGVNICWKEKLYVHHYSLLYAAAPLYVDHMYLSTPAPSTLLFESRGPGRGTVLPLLVVCHALPEVLHPPTEQTPEQWRRKHLTQEETMSVPAARW